MSSERGFMDRALALAERGTGRVEPNPVVGAVVTAGGEIVGEGWHGRYGGPHAEVAALSAAGERAAGSTVYVTLEPCGHTGKTPPCARALIDAGVSRVVYASADPNPETAGRGPEMLREAGIEVEAGLLGDAAAKQQQRYLSFRESPVPWTVAKWAMTLDGKIADVEGGSRFITGPEARRLVHEVRGAVDAVVVGVGTAVKDDPDLSPREGEPVRDPIRIVVDTRLRTPPDSRLARTAREHPVWIATAPASDAGAAGRLESAGCRVLRMALKDGRVDLAALFRVLRSEGIHRVLLEGGGEMLASAFAAGLVHQVMAFTAPLVLGGRTAPTPVDGEGFRRIGSPQRLQDVRVERLGTDILVEGFTDTGSACS